MRQLWIQVPQGRGQEVVEIAQRHRAGNLARFEAVGDQGPIDVALVHVSNAQMGPLLAELERISDLQVSFAPQGVFALRPPAEEAPSLVTEVEARSALEVFLSGLQSVGSWKGFLSYALAAGAVVWIGLFSNKVYLLIAAMLIAPFAGPAMNAALATARGDGMLLGRSLLRYFASLVVTVAAAALLSLLLGQQIATPQMLAASEISSTAFLLPLVAGAAGALNLCQSPRSSLVSGAATGVLVAASLAPPAGLLGMAPVIGRWDMVQSACFLLLLQIVGINISGAVVFRIFGLSASGPRYRRGKPWVFPTALGATAAMLLGLLFWQFSTSPDLQRSTREQRAAAVAQKVVNESGLALLVEANVRFTRADIPGQESLLMVLYVQRSGDSRVSEREIRSRLRQAVQARLREKGFQLTPLIDVSVLEG